MGEGEEPPGTSWPNDHGGKGYGGQQPPVGDEPHRFFFRVYALDSSLELGPDADLDAVHAALEQRRLATGTLVGLFAR